MFDLAAAGWMLSALPLAPETSPGAGTASFTNVVADEADHLAASMYGEMAATYEYAATTQQEHTTITSISIFDGICIEPLDGTATKTDKHAIMGTSGNVIGNTAQPTAPNTLNTANVTELGLEALYQSVDVEMQRLVAAPDFTRKSITIEPAVETGTGMLHSPTLGTHHTTTSESLSHYTMGEPIDDEASRTCKGLYVESMAVINNLAWGNTQADLFVHDPMSILEQDAADLEAT
ncbi:uncharacterized protein ALTATR162_LOCUS9 [Alternaria atra]|uniref:Uncharacterized protein n=1 Tax=Alternaria atra TaxID=119953 RepID=A0A8J2HT54_9PLEO|nr:uncharacterized protein ALTATR162_LOCUS9 [Alternaria atra]CAG5136915.1 unnamed protein product [Alternaria atra]